MNVSSVRFNRRSLDAEATRTEETRHWVARKPHRRVRCSRTVSFCDLKLRHNASLLWHSPVAATHFRCELSLFARECIHRAGHRIARVHHLSIVVRHLRRRWDGSSGRGCIEKRHGVKRLVYWSTSQKKAEPSSLATHSGGSHGSVIFSMNGALSSGGSV